MRLFIKEFYNLRKCKCNLVKHPYLSNYLAIQDAITGHYIYPFSDSDSTFGFRYSPWFFEINKIERIKAMLNYES